MYYYINVPSYKYWLDNGATSLWEGFNELYPNGLFRLDGGRVLSLNHHFWGDISAWFYTYLAGIRINPTGRNVKHVDFMPCFVDKLDYVCARHRHPQGEIAVKWTRTGADIEWVLSVPDNINGEVLLPEGYAFKNGKNRCSLELYRQSFEQYATVVSIVQSQK